MRKLESIHRKIDWITGPGSQGLAEGIAEDLAEGNRYDRLNGRTSDGTTIAPLKTKRKGIYKGATGPPLAPFGAQSRTVSRFKAKARRTGKRGYTVVAGWENVVSKAGFPFLPVHDAGAGRMPHRPFMGPSPRTLAAIRKRIDGFKAKAARKGKGK